MIRPFLSDIKIENSDMQRVQFNNSDVEDMEINNTLVQNVSFDKNSKVSNITQYQVSIATSLEPVTSYIDYIDRVIQNQLVERF